jgi:hypothetical protein
LFIKIDSWRNPYEVDEFISSCHASSCANLPSVQKVLTFYQDFQQKQQAKV